MDPKPQPTQPFSCHVCSLNFSNGKALALHLQEKHEPHFTHQDREWLRSIRIKAED